MAEQALSVLRADVWLALSRRLEEAARQMSSAAARDVLARPLELLALMASDAPAALGDDALAAERLRMLLYLAAPFHALVDEARALGETASPRELAGSYEPGVLDHGALALLGLAALRVAPPGAHEVFIGTVHGLALSAAPAEALGRLVPRLPEAASLAVILDTLYLLDTVGAALKTPLLRPFANDAAERARWKCLAGLFERDLPAALKAALQRASLPEGKPPPWDGATSGEIEDVQPQRAAPGQPLIVTGRLGGKLSDAVRVVFASADHAPLPAKVISFDGGARTSELRVEVPAGARAGWVGLSDDRLVRASNELRLALRETLPTVLARRGCLRGAEVPVQLLPLIGTPDPTREGKLLAVPPRTAGARFAGPAQAPTGSVRAAVLANPLATTPGSQRTPHLAALEASQQGRKAPLFADQPLEVQVVLDAAVEPRLVNLLLDPAPQGSPALLPTETQQPGQRFLFTVPAEAAQDGLVVTALLGAAGDPAEVKTLGPLALLPRRQLRLVLARPQVLEPALPAVDFATVEKFIPYLERELGLAISAVQLPFVDDELAVLTTPLAGGDDARVPALLEALSRRALLTPHLEDAVWLLLVPEPPLSRAASTDPDELARAKALGARNLLERAVASGRGFFRSMPAEAARAVAVADPLGLPALLAELVPVEARAVSKAAPTTRLRLLGTLAADEVLIESAKEELRAAGPGAPLDSGLTVTALDKRGREITVGRVSCLRHARPAQLALLVPVSPEVTAVEVWRGSRRLARVDRTSGEGQLEAASLSVQQPDQQQALQWSFQHSKNARPELALALGWGRLATEVLRIDACDAKASLHLTRYQKADRLALFASDGWNLVERAVLGDDGKPAAIDNPTPVLIRRLADGRFFADVPAGFSVGWSIDGGALPATSRLLSLPDGARGTLQLRAREGKGVAVLIDERKLEALP